MMALVGVGLLTSAVGCGPKTKRLSEAEKNHYYALQVWMEKKEQRLWLRLKTKDERDAWLKKRGLWERFYAFDEDMRNQIVAGEVEVGWEQPAVQMAWGMPHSRKRLTGRPATRSELFVYRFEVDAEGYVTVWKPKSKTVHRAVDLYQLDVYLDDGRVTELIRKDKWE